MPLPEAEQPRASEEPTIAIPAARIPDVEEMMFGGTGPARQEEPEEFEDDPVEQVAQAPAPPPVLPPPKPKTLRKRTFNTLYRFAEALIPPGGDPPYSASEAKVAQRLDGSMGSWDPAAVREVGRALTLLEWSPLASRALRPLSRMRDAQAAVARQEHSRLPSVRAAFDLVRTLCLEQYAATPEIERAVGFDYSCLLNEPARPQPSLEVIGYPQIDRDHVEDCDVVVVGSGAGGAVAAKELAELGLSVVILEEGPAVERADMAGPPFVRAQRLYRSSGIHARAGAVSVPQGFGVGGSTLVSTGVAMRAPDFVLDRWASTFGLPGLDPASMAPLYERVERISKVAPVGEDLLGLNGAVLRAGSQRAGHPGSPAMRTIEGCRGCGTCTAGCPTDANLSVRATYLPRAQRAGATIFSGARARAIHVTGGAARGVVADLLDPQTRERKATLTVRARLVVLAAGALHTPALLERSALGNVAGLLGRNLRLHPAAMVGAIFDEQIVPWLGAQDAYVVDDMLLTHGVLIQSSAALPAASAAMWPGAGSYSKEMMARARSVATAAVYVADTATGRVTHTRGEPVVSYRMNDHDARRLTAGILRCARMFFEAGATSVCTSLPHAPVASSWEQLRDIDAEEDRTRPLRLVGRHPAGTAAMGVDPATSVVDPYGRVHGVESLYVADASILPEGPAVGPQLTVMALATRLADHLARAGS